MELDTNQRLEFMESEISAYRVENDRLAQELNLTRAVLGSLQIPGDAIPAAGVSGLLRLPRPNCTGDDIIFHIDRHEMGDQFFLIVGWAFCPRIDCGNAVLSLLLEGTGPTFLAKPDPEVRPDIAAAHAQTDLGVIFPPGSPGRSRLALSGFRGLWRRSPLGKSCDSSVAIQIDGPDFSVRRPANLTVHG